MRNWRAASPKRRLISRRRAKGGRKDGGRRLKRSSIGSGVRPYSPAPARRARPRSPSSKHRLARGQNAKSWELRGATSLARLRRQQGRHEEAVALLTPVIGWFEEGFDTADLQAARAVLDESAGGAGAAANVAAVTTLSG